ncbi:MAG TPA: prolipoprotein diacylglyceryl transferase family protein [Anaerolineae bacterium]|nr:prolipoprotein diacylglyceryl transferase family protein [Anaerolineae bacterium]
MQPIFWQWGDITISSYAVCMVLGLIAGTFVSLSEARRRHIRSAIVLDAILAASVLGVIAARLGYVLINWIYYQDHTAEIPRLWLGGLNWQAGLIGGSIGAWLIARRHGSSMIILDMLAIGTALGACFGWIGSYLSATAYGKELFPGQPFFFLAIDAPDWYGLTNPRWPTQIIGAAWALILFLLLWFTRQKTWSNGVRYWLFVAAYSLGVFLLGFTRGDDIPLLGGWRIDQILDALLFSLALIALVWLRLKSRTSPQPVTPTEAGANSG